MNTLTFRDELTLLGFLSKKGDPTTTGGLRTALKPVMRNLLLDLPMILPRLSELSLIEKLPAAPRTRSLRWKLAPPGHETLQTRLGDSPRRGRGWLVKAARALATGRMLGVAPRTAAILASEQDALAAFYLATRLGMEFLPGMTPLSLARELAAGELHAANARPQTLWNGLMERALAVQPPGSPEECSLPSCEPFAAQVQRTARTAAVGWFGTGKLFIHRAWETWREHTGATLTLPEFKERLLMELRAGNLGLTRADFTHSLNTSDLAEAEIRDGAETFHFLTATQAGERN